MTKEELENKCTERAKIFQQAIENCKSSNPMDCIEWFADRILELEKVCQDLSDKFDYQVKQVVKLENENGKLEGKLTEANDLLLRFIELKNKPCAVGHSVNMLLYENICAEAEQFLEVTE